MGFSTELGKALARLPLGTVLSIKPAAVALFQQIVDSRGDVTTVEELHDKIKARETEARNESD